MKNISLKALILSIATISIFSISYPNAIFSASTKPIAPAKVTTPTKVETLTLTETEKAAYSKVSPLELVNTPAKYLNTKVTFKATFVKFSKVGLDYPAVKRDSKDYISFAIKRPDTGEYTIPLSELKLMVKRDFAEKNLISLESGDEIEVYGEVFSTALNDPWVEVNYVKILTVKKKKPVDADAETEK